MRLLFLSALASLLIAAPGLASAREGEMFGFRLGDRYPLATNERTGLSGSYRYIGSETARKPDTIAAVTILTLPTSLKIVAISGSRSFRDSAEAWRFHSVLASALAAKYRFSWHGSRTLAGSEVILGGQFRLALWVQPRRSGHTTVFVSLTRADMRPWASMARRELRQEVLRPAAEPFLMGF